MAAVLAQLGAAPRSRRSAVSCRAQKEPTPQAPALSTLDSLLLTGCGLPPGPGGSLGALEGVSYLLLVGVFGASIQRKVTTGTGLPAGPGGALGAVEGVTFLAVLAGVVVAGLTIVNSGALPSALPDARCFGN